MANLHLIKDVDLKWLLFAYYNQVQVIKEVQDAEQQATITLVGPYFLQRFPMDDGPGQPPLRQKGEEPNALAKDFEFRNLVFLRLRTARNCWGFIRLPTRWPLG
jgi:hypothetical protein